MTIAAVVQLCAGARPSRSATPGNRHGAARGSRRLGASTGHRVLVRAPLRRGGRRIRAARRRRRRPARRPLRGAAARRRAARAAAARAAGSLLTWIGAAPEELVESYARARAAIDDAPTPGDMAMEPIDVAWVRRMEATAASRRTRVAGHRRDRRERRCRLVHRPARLAAAVRRSRRRTTRRRSPRRAASGSPTPSRSSLCGDCAPSVPTWRSSARVNAEHNTPCAR